ncbi:hypothetical protein A2U01_0097359, partial [Trifolium medium]|nr:hypothetical protein [Trifolium medium]
EKEKRKRDATSVSDKDEVTKKQRTQKNRAPRAPRKFVVYEEDDEKTDEEHLQSKRNRTEPEAKKMNAEADA